MKGVELQEEIIKWLERRREQFLNAAQTAKIPLSIQTTRPVITNLSENSYQSHEETIATTPFTVPTFAISLQETMVPTPDDIQDSPASVLYETYGDRCKVWNPIQQHNFDIDPAEWIFKVLLSRIQAEYLFNLSSLETGNCQLAETLAKDLISLIEGVTVNFVTALPLAGIQLAEDSIEVEDTRLRKLTLEELSQISDFSTDRLWARQVRRGLLPPFPRHVTERTILEVRTPCIKLVQPSGDLLPQRLVLALELLGFELHGAGSATTWTEPGPSLWSGGQGFGLGRNGTSKECTRDDLRRGLAIARRIPNGVISSPGNREEVVLHRFLLGCAEDNSADKLIDYVIAMEGFLLPQVKEGEHRFKFAFCGSWYLAVEPGERATLFRNLQDIYDTRSRIVHGSTPEPEASTRQEAMKARNLASRLLVKGLEQEWPSHETLKSLALGLN